MNSTLTLETLAESRPPHGNGAPSRTRSHYDRILVLLRERGPAGVLSSELYDQPQLFGRSPRNRISEMRQDGHLIKTLPAGASVVRYILTHENPSRAPRPLQQIHKARNSAGAWKAHPIVPTKSWEEWDRERNQPKPEAEWSLTP
jgi:hypothetical protein